MNAIQEEKKAAENHEARVTVNMWSQIGNQTANPIVKFRAVCSCGWSVEQNIQHNAVVLAKRHIRAAR